MHYNSLKLKGEFMNELKNYNRVLQIIKNSDEVVGPKIVDFIYFLPEQLMAAINEGEEKGVARENSKTWKFNQEKDVLKIVFSNGIKFNKSSIGKVELTLNVSDNELSKKSLSHIAQFVYEVYNGVECVKSIDADFNAKKIANNNYICDCKVENLPKKMNFGQNESKISIAL